ncbi:ADP-ribosylglycohydrolase family protein [Streptomyces sp. IBSBF 2953]|uniref:ADP-ribosylglycohydrolase family protein n=1 Tax=Streptomyces TaxID=1883 RepID=UPI002119B9AF|nr:ADP-ribosylglycohydrolase family protein [Streptomyces scabiei]MCQ9180227.1 ADP-ribosylglycohydrolase family protein [Streptomyces hayashii]MDX3118323.1 ADP-ribosylglycohydrolase family protein [Streptomyces scabiei]
MLRLTWVQPEDLLGHELRQAAEDGREAGAIAARWKAAGGCEAPARAGASPQRASRYLRLLAEDLLDELADLPSRSAEDEPTELERIKALCPRWPGRPDDVRPAAPLRARPPAVAPARLEAAWLGRAVGCLLGKPVEKLPLDAIRALARSAGNWPLTGYFTARGVPAPLLDAHPWNRRSASTSLAENIDGMPEDDDLDYPLLNLLLLQRHGKDFTTEDVARLWLDELPPGRAFTAERVALRNLLCGVEPPHTARHRNPFREWIGALIRADVHGWTNPGDPAAAAEQAHRDACLTHTANGVYAAMFTAAVIAAAATGDQDVHACLRTGLTVVPPRSRLFRAVEHAVRLAGEHPGPDEFDTVVDELHAAHPASHWVHAVPNTALIAAALTHADGDFTRSVRGAVAGGLDTDSAGATAGGVAALLAGDPAALPDHWTGPLKNRLATSVADFDGVGFDTLAHLTWSLAHREASRP